MNERPAPSPPDTPPPTLLHTGRAGSACPTRSPLSGDRHLPTPPHPTPIAAPRARHPHRAPARPTPRPVPGRRGGGRGTLPQFPEGTHRSVRARPPPPPPRPRSRSRRCPRRRRPALFSLGKLQAHVSPGAGRGRQWGGGGRGVARRPVDVWLT